MLVLFSLLLASCIPSGGIFVDTGTDKEEEVVETSEEEETPTEDAETGEISDGSEEGDHDPYPWLEKYRNTVYDCYSDDHVDKFNLANWSPVTPKIICDIGVMMNYREIFVIDAEGNRSSGTSQHKRYIDNQDLPGDAIDFLLGRYSGNCQDDNDKYLNDAQMFRGHLLNSRWGEFCAIGFYPKRRSIHLDCRGYPASWCHYKDADGKLIQTSIADCIINFDILKRDCS